MGNSFKLDDLLRDDDGVKPPQKKKGAAATEGYALDDLLGPDTATAPPPRTGNVDLREGAQGGPTAPATPVPAPAPRRGIMQRIGDAITDFITPSESTAKAMVQGAQGQMPIAQMYRDDAEERRLLPTGDTRTPARRKADAVAVKRKYDATIGQRPDNTSVAPDAAVAPLVRNQLDTNLASGRQHDAQVAAEEAQAEANYTPEQHRDLERRGVAYAAKLNQQAMDLRASDPAAAEALHQRAELFNKKAANHGLVASGIAATDNNAAAFTSSLLGPISDPFAGQRTNLATAARGEGVFSPDELAEIGRNTPVANAKNEPLVSGRTAASLAGSLPWFVAGDALVAGGIKGAAAMFPKFGGIADALGASLEVAPRMGPARAGFGGAVDAAKEFAGDIPTLARRGATIGQVPGAAIAAREAQQRGDDPTHAALESVAANLAMGPAGEILFGAAGAAGRTIGRSIENIDRKLRPHLDPTYNRMGGLDVPPSEGHYLPEVRAAAEAFAKPIEAAREVEGKTPLGDQTPGGQLNTIAKALSSLLDQKRAAEPIGEEIGQAAPPPADRRWWESNAPTEPMIEPGSALRPREEPADVPLRSQRDIANERAGTPRGEADAVVQMERARRDEQLARENEARMAEEARIEAAAAQSAREKQGPLTLSQTIARAGKDAEAGEPLAVEYKQAINDHIDALARVQDAGEKGPTTRDRIALARSKVKLDELRKKYGAQTGAAALLAIASSNQDLTDDEKKMVGLGAFAMGSTAVVHHLAPETLRIVSQQLGKHLDATNMHERFPVENWESQFGAWGVRADQFTQLTDAVRQLDTGEGVSGAEVQQLVRDRIGAQPKRFVSRLANHVESLPKKWDQPTPAKVWMDLLGKKGNPYSMGEFDQALRQSLKVGIEDGEKFTKQDILGFIEQDRPRIAETRLTEGGRTDTGPLTLHPGEGTHEVQNIRSREGAGTYETYDYEDGPRVQEVAEEFQNEIDDATRRHEEAEQSLSDAHSRVEREAEELGIRNAAVHRALQQAEHDGDYGQVVDVDEAIQHLIEEMDNSPQLPSDAAVARRNGRYEIRTEANNHNTVAHGRTELEAMVNAERDGYLSLGGENDVLDTGDRVAPMYDTLDEGYHTEGYRIKIPDDERVHTAAFDDLAGSVYSSREKAEEIVRAEAEHAGKPVPRFEIEQLGEDDADRWGIAHYDGDEFSNWVNGDGTYDRFSDPDEAIQDHINNNWRIDESRIEDLRNAISNLADEQHSYGEIESETYQHRDEPGELLQRGSHWYDRFEEAQDLDREERAELEAQRAQRIQEGGYDTRTATGDYWHLDQDTRDAVDAARERGAVGTLSRILPDDGAVTELVFDPDVPHHPLPSPGERTRDSRDPEQQEMFEGMGGEAMFVTRAEQPQEPKTFPALPGDGQTKYSNVQAIPGGQRRRELLLQFENNPGEKYTGSNAASHQHYRQEDMIGHARVNDRFYYGEEGTTPEIDALHERRAQIIAEQNKVVTEHMELSPADRMDRSHGSLAQQMLKKFMDLNGEMNSLGAEEEKLRAKLPSRKTKRPMMVTVAEELQSDYAQDASRQVLKQSLSEPSESQAKKIADYIRRGEKLPPELELLPPGYRKPAPNRDELLATAEQERQRIANDELLPLMEQKNVLNTEEEQRVEELSQKAIAAGYPDDEAFTRGKVVYWLKQNDATIPDAVKNEINQWYDTGVHEARLRQRELDSQIATVEKKIDALSDENVGFENPYRPPVTPWTDKGAINQLLAGRLLLEAVDSDADMVGWSHSSNRMAMSHGYSMAAAKLNYDEQVPSAMSKLLAAIGFKDVKPELLTMSGYRWWGIKLTPEMKAAVKKFGVPTLSVLGMLAAPDPAQAQDGKVEGAKLYGSAAGIFAAGALISAMATNRKLRAAIKENRELSRELLLDDLSGLANGRAFRRAKESVDRAEGMSWATWDGNRFKKLNDEHGHPEGDKAIQHFGKIVREQAEKLGIPMRGFRPGGDEFAFAVPSERAAEFVKAVEDASTYTKGDVTTSLTGAHANTFAEADALLKQYKEAARKLDPTLRREGGEPITGGGATMYANPVGPAVQMLKKYPSSAGVAAVGAMMTQSDNEQVKRAGVPVMALGALSAIGSRRLYAGADFLGHTLVEQLRKSNEGSNLVRAFNPDALLSPEVTAAIREYERGSAQGKARAAEFSGKAKKLGPVGDRAVSDVLENEQWEPAQAQTADVFAVATELDNEYKRLTQEQLAAGTLAPSQVLPNYGGPRRYAFYEAQDALADTPSSGGTPRSAKITGQKSRTLDIPIRDAEDKLRFAQASGDPQAISDAQDALDQAKVVQLSQRVERGEIREASYRAAQGIERAHHNVASAKLFETLRNTPGTVHPEWQAALDDLLAAKDMYRNATSQADKDVAEQLQNDAGAKISEITRRFKQRDGDYVSLPDTPAMGMLRGAVVQRDVAHSLEGFDAPQLYGKMLRSWKEIKTVFNVGTHIGNVLSNVTALHLGDVPVWLQPLYYKKALTDLKNYGEGTRALAEAGVMNVNAVTALGEGQLGRGMRTREGLEELLPTTRPETQQVLRANGIDEPSIARRNMKSKIKGMAVGATLGAAKQYDPDHPEDALVGAAVGGALGGVFRSGRANKLRAIYGHEDNIARLAVFLRRRKLGDTIEQATAQAVASLGDFRSRSPALRMISSTVSPFIMYQAKAVPAFARNIVDHPWKYLSLMAAWGAVNELGKQEMGEVPETDKPLNQRQDFGYFFPGFTQLPFGDERGNKAAVDMARWTPLSGMTTGAPPGSLPEAFSDQGMSLVTPGGPVIDAALQGSNVDPYTKGPLIKRDRPTRENVGALLNKAADFALPSSLGFHTTRLMEDMDNEDWTKFKNDLFGPLGIKPKYVRPGAVAVDAEYTLERSLRDMKQELRQALRANKSEERVPELTRKYQRDVAQALLNFKERVGAPPSAALVNEFLTPNP